MTSIIITKNSINPNLERALSKSIKNYNPRIGVQVADAVHSSLDESLGCDPAEIIPQTTIIKGLGAESIDGLDISFKLGKQLGVPVPRQNLLVTEQGEYQTVLSMAQLVYDIYTKQKR